MIVADALAFGETRSTRSVVFWRTEARRGFNYYRQNQDRMKYDIYSANGWFIGSGVIESGCKTIVCQRFKQSGMIWSLNGVKSLLPLRTLLNLFFD